MRLRLALIRVPGLLTVTPDCLRPSRPSPSAVSPAPTLGFLRRAGPFVEVKEDFFSLTDLRIREVLARPVRLSALAAGFLLPAVAEDFFSSTELTTREILTGLRRLFALTVGFLFPTETEDFFSPAEPTTREILTGLSRLLELTVGFLFPTETDDFFSPTEPTTREIVTGLKRLLELTVGFLFPTETEDFVSPIELTIREVFAELMRLLELTTGRLVTPVASPAGLETTEEPTEGLEALEAIRTLGVLVILEVTLVGRRLWVILVGCGLDAVLPGWRKEDLGILRELLPIDGLEVLDLDRIPDIRDGPEDLMRAPPMFEDRQVLGAAEVFGAGLLF